MVMVNPHVTDRPHIVDHRFAPSERRTLICRPGDRHKTLVDERGSLRYEEHDVVSQRLERRMPHVVRFGLSSGEQHVAVEQFMDDPRTPIVTTVLRYHRCELELVACGHVDATGRRLDLVRWRLLGLSDVGDPLETLHVESIGGWGFEPVMVASIPAATGGAVALVLDGPDLDADRPPPEWVDRALDQERQFWAGLMLPPNELRVPDRGVMRLLDASARTITQTRPAWAGGLEENFSRIEAAQFLGLERDARDALEDVLGPGQPDGPTEGDQLATTAARVAAIVRHHELGGTVTLAERETEVIRRALLQIGALNADRSDATSQLWARAAGSAVGRAAFVPPDVRAAAMEMVSALPPVLTTGEPGSDHLHALTWAISPGDAFAPDDPVVIDAAATEAAPSRVCLYAGQSAEAVDHLYALANHAPPTGPTSSASLELVRLVRDLVVFERGDELVLLGGVPAAWWKPGAQIAVTPTPTRFGPLSLRMAVSEGGVASVEVDAEFVRQPARIVVRPPAATAWVRVDGHDVDVAERSIRLPVAARVRMTVGLIPTHQTILGHSAVKAAARDWRTLSSAAPFKPDLRVYHQLPIETDPPAHGDYRAVLTPFFTRQRLAELEPALRAVASRLVAGLESSGAAEVVHELALPMVVGSLGVVLGRPQDVDEWLSWGLRNNEPHGRRDSRRTEAYLVRVFDEVGRRPGTDAFSHLTRAHLDGRPLTRSERLGFGSLLLTAGRGAVVNLICGAIWHLAANLTERIRLAQDPSLLVSAIEEYLRYLSPVPQMPRLASAEVAGDTGSPQVALSFLSANHDPTVFVQPEIVDLGRRPNPHLAFGNGPHFCIGANLGKLEARLLLEELLRDVPNFTLDGDPDVEWESAPGTKVPGEFMSLRIKVTE